MAASDVNASGQVQFIEVTLGGAGVAATFPPARFQLGTFLCDRSLPGLYFLVAISGTKAWHKVNTTSAWAAFSATA